MPNLIEIVKNAGIVGAGGAGFPTHVKINTQAQVVIANGAECEPLLSVDQQLMERDAERVARGLLAVKEQVGATRAVVGLKAHYKNAVAALEALPGCGRDFELHQTKSFYPVGDEQQLIYEITGRVVPTGGLPVDVGAVVVNVGTLINVARALDGGAPVTEKTVTVGGAVQTPLTLTAPVGTPISALLRLAGAPEDLGNYTLVIGGPCMGEMTKDAEQPITKTTGGILVFPDGHPLLPQKDDSPCRDIALAKAVCCNCSMCTQLCPRNMLGLAVEPHKAMRAFAYEDGKLMTGAGGVFSCCDCGVCTYFACNFGLKPSLMMKRLKTQLAKAGMKPAKEVPFAPDPGIGYERLPTSRLVARLGLAEYDRPAPPRDGLVQTNQVRIPLRMHIGAPAVPVVAVGTHVEKNDLIADIAPDQLGAKIHASIAGTVTAVGEGYIEITV